MKHQLLYIFLLFTLFVSANTYNQQFLQAVMEGNEQIALDCLQKGADINALDEGGLALMHRFASRNNASMMQWLIEKGADINVLDFEGSTPLMYAVALGHYRLVYKMLLWGADRQIQNLDNQTAFTLAEECGFLRMVALLKNPNSYSERPTTIELCSQREAADKEGDWHRAIALARQEQKQASKEWSVTSPYYTRGLSDEGLIYIKLGRFEEAEKALRRALKHTEKYNPNSEIYYFKLTGLAFLYSQMSRHTEAIQIYNECIEYIELFENPQTIWQLYSGLAAEYTELGEYDLAEYNYQKALQYVDQLPAYIRTSAYCITKGNIASAHYFQNTPSAIKLFANEMKEVLQVMEKYQLFDQNYIRFKHTICDYYIGFGYLEQATKEIEKLKSITKQLFGVEHDDYLSALAIAGRIAFQQNNYQTAYQNYSEALDVIIHRVTRSPKLEADIVSEWANLVDILLEDSTSVWAYQFAYNTYNTLYGEKSVYTIRSINDLGTHYADCHQFDLALPYFRKAYEIQRDYYGVNTLNTIINESNLWECMAAIPLLRDSAYHYLLDTDKNIRHYLQGMFGVMTEQQREEFWKEKLSVDYAVKMPSFLIDYAQYYNYPKAFGDIYDGILLQRGLLLNSNDAMHKIVAQSEDTLLKKSWSNLLTLKAELNSSSALSKNTRQQLEQRKEQLEQSIMQSSIDFRLAQENFSLHWQDIQDKLNSNEVAIEFMVNAVNHWGLMHTSTDSVMYYALVLRKNNEYPIFIPLFERDELACFMWSKQQMYDYNIYADSIYNLIWRKIEPHLLYGETIYFAPTHALTQIALEALPITQDSVIGDYYNMVRLSSTREILHIKEQQEMYDAVLYGGITYDVSADEMMEESLKYNIPPHQISRSIEWDTINRGRVKYLPGTKREVEKINIYLTEQKRPTSVFTGAAANEESFVSLSGKHNSIIHIATHGFYWNQEQAENQDVFKTGQKGEDDPLLRCGLLFAGANIAFSGRVDLLKDGVQDGILTAREIVPMDLSNCQLVVLSACETGRGEYSNDGTIGLQRAFKLAGVKTIIMSLWPVNDSATQMLMSEFYANWLDRKQSKREAFRNAQNAVRAHYTEPYYWAGFVMLD